MSEKINWKEIIKEQIRVFNENSEEIKKEEKKNKTRLRPSQQF